MARYASYLESSRSPVHDCLPEDIFTYETPVAVRTDYDATQGITGIRPETPDEPVSGAMGLLLSVLTDEPFNLDRSAITGPWHEKEEKGDSFDPYATVEDLLPAAAFAEFRRRFAANEAGHELLYADTLPYLSKLGDALIPNDTLTWGRYDYQVDKITAARVPGHVEITSQKKKGKVINDMRVGKVYPIVALDDDDRPMALVNARSVILVDDKAASFEHLPGDCKGKLLTRPGEERKKSQAGTVDHNQVKTITGLDSFEITPDMRPDFSRRQSVVMRAAKKYVPLKTYAAVQR
ncbi:MAG TPA: hypothetical protein VF572_03180 [Candidatus Saccharimonadales bacterium]|jgi:hypothetical protein